MSRFVHGLKIGGISLKNNLVLSPLAGFTDIAFRRLCRECGAALTVTEMVSVNGLYYGNVKTQTLLQRFDGESPSTVQLFGSSPEVFRKVIAECEMLAPFDIIDINMGCPMPKVTSLGAGSALLKDPARAEEIVRACVESAKGKPITVKMRLGISSALGAEEFAERMDKAGAAAITVHGRTAKQLYGGKADWQMVGRIKEAVKVPVFGNGDITSKEDFEQKMSESGVDGVGIGRGALGNPMLFAVLAGENAPLTRKEAALRHIEYMEQYFSSKYAAVNFRKHVGHYLKAVPDSRRLKQSLMQASTAEEVRNLLFSMEDQR